MQTAVELLGVFLDNVGAFFTVAFGWVSDVITLVQSHPALLVLVIAMPIVGFAVGLLSRLIRA